MFGVSAQKFFKMFFSAIIDGRRVFEHSTLSLATCGTQEFLPMTIGIKKNEKSYNSVDFNASYLKKAARPCRL